MHEVKTTARVLGVILRLSLRVATVALIAPWVIFALLRRYWRACSNLAGFLLGLRATFASHLRCPRGHLSSLHGVWECRTCGALFAGWAFQYCRVCGQSCGYVTCEHCGLAVKSPLM